MKSSGPFAFFDDIVCINLETVPERRAYAQGIFHRLGIPARFFVAKKHPKGGRYGCFDSHIQVVRQAYEAGAERLLVFEDDLLPTPAYTSQAIQEAIQFMRENQDWDIFYLGYFPFNFSYGRRPFLLAPTVASKFPSIIQYNPCGAHALCYNRRAMKIVLDHAEAAIGNIHYDIWLADHLGLRNYCYAPMLFEQTLLNMSQIPAHTVCEWMARRLWHYSERYLLFYQVSRVKHRILGKEQEIVFWLVLLFIVWFSSRRRGRAK